jgi:DNA processing protein
MEKQDCLLVTLSLLSGIGRATLRRVRASLQTGEFWHYSCRDMQEKLAVSEKVAERIMAEVCCLEKGMERIVQWRKRGVEIMTRSHSEYPSLLQEIPDPPEVLYIMGRRELLTRPAIGIVGTRAPTVYGKQVARQLARELVERRMGVVSGLARGIDSEAHRGALEQGGDTIAVLGCGVDIVYPTENRKVAASIREQGVIVSEYPPGTQPRRGFFPERNRIISGLSRGIVVVEAASRSGSLITADLAGDQGRDVFAVPGSIYSPKSAGCHWLIQQGAKVVQSIHDIVCEYPDLFSDTNENTNEHKADVPVHVTREEKQILEMIGWEPVSYEEILCRTSFSSSYLHYLLLSLQVKQQITQLPGPTFMRIKE